MTENNSNHLFVNLSHVLLSKIHNQLTNNFDRLRFSLTCKKWYNDKDHYFSFIVDDIQSTTDSHSLNILKQSIALSSYSNLLVKSLQSKSNCKLGISNGKTHLYTDYKYNLIRNNIKDLEIDKSIYKIEIWDWNDNNILDERFIEKLINSNVCQIDILCNVLTSFKQLPSNIKQVKCTFGFHMKLLPSKLERLHFIPTVSKFNITSSDFDMKLLPQSLKFLQIDMANFILNIETLPPNLEEFICFSRINIQQCQSPIIPHSLFSLTCTFKFWKHLISNSPIPTTIKYMDLSTQYDDFLQANCIPESVETLKLYFGFGCHLTKDQFPKTLLNLEIMVENFEMITCEIDLFKYMNRLESLTIEGAEDCNFGQLPKNIRFLNLQGPNVKFELPDGFIIDSYLLKNKDFPNISNSIPNNCKSLKFSNNINQPLKIGMIPNQIQSIDFGSYKLSIVPSVIGSSNLNHIKISYSNILSNFTTKTFPSNINSIQFSYRIIVVHFSRLDENYFIYQFNLRSYQIGLININKIVSYLKDIEKNIL
ncbi:hypothetical protein PPL_08006 [Heterostelium album PN500]|uniref:F-box domain-containing protein n=1 Tax=Heterostelium pallidum (strain ATCC 26659 / Pp 5 / PN500) TaxID=670386 RepID=D3BHK3_HETP5|nr:hypothetical protein PPL_08006 [Heterostelium album PN500]EFA79180.1 hypothetical protein PPL_08006 [Heterostelium album PN500]|eukprot:XP_020431301.1 hypothetical protein PPL_08006 [Heterostelium album PN500]